MATRGSRRSFEKTIMRLAVEFGPILRARQVGRGAGEMGVLSSSCCKQHRRFCERTKQNGNPHSAKSQVPSAPVKESSRTLTTRMTSISDPKRPQGKRNNWIQAVSGRGWNMLFRLYGPLEPWFDKTWRPGEVKLIE